MSRKFILINLELLAFLCLNVILLLSDYSFLTVSEVHKGMYYTNTPIEITASRNNMGIVVFRLQSDLSKYDARATVDIQISNESKILHKREIQLFDLTNLKEYPAGFEVDRSSRDKTYFVSVSIHGYQEHIGNLPLTIILKYRSDRPSNFIQLADFIFEKLLYAYTEYLFPFIIVFYFGITLSTVYLVLLYDRIKPSSRYRCNYYVVMFLIAVLPYGIFVYNIYLFFLTFIIGNIILRKSLGFSITDSSLFIFSTLGATSYIFRFNTLSNYYIVLFLLYLAVRMYYEQKN